MFECACVSLHCLRMRINETGSKIRGERIKENENTDADGRSDRSLFFSHPLCVSLSLSFFHTFVEMVIADYNFELCTLLTAVIEHISRYCVLYIFSAVPIVTVHNALNMCYWSLCAQCGLKFIAVNFWNIQIARYYCLWWNFNYIVLQQQLLLLPLLLRFLMFAKVHLDQSKVLHFETKAIAQSKSNEVLLPGKFPVHLKMAAAIANFSLFVRCYFVPVTVTVNWLFKCLHAAVPHISHICELWGLCVCVSVWIKLKMNCIMKYKYSLNRTSARVHTPHTQPNHSETIQILTAIELISINIVFRLSACMCMRSLLEH